MTSRRWYVSLIGLELRKMFTYRLNFWSEFLGSVLGYFGIAYFVWSAVYAESGAATISGYSLHMMLLYQIMVPVVGKATYASDFSSISDEIYTGSLNRYLIYPISFFVYKFFQQMTSNAFVIFQLSLILVAYALTLGFPSDFVWSPMQFSLFLVTFALSMTLAFLVSWTIQMVSFWADQVWSLMVSFRILVHFFGGAWVPLALFPESVQNILRFCPFYLVVAFPIEVFLGRANLRDITTGIFAQVGWIALMSVVGTRIWRRGLHTYSGVGI